MPKTAQVKRGDTLIEENVENLRLGDVVVVRPGDRIPVDGTVRYGSSARKAKTSPARAHSSLRATELQLATSAQAG